MQIQFFSLIYTQINYFYVTSFAYVVDAPFDITQQATFRSRGYAPETSLIRNIMYIRMYNIVTRQRDLK